MFLISCLAFRHRVLPIDMTWRRTLSVKKSAHYHVFHKMRLHCVRVCMCACVCAKDVCAHTHIHTRILLSHIYTTEGAETIFKKRCTRRHTLCLAVAPWLSLSLSFVFFVSIPLASSSSLSLTPSFSLTQKETQRQRERSCARRQNCNPLPSCALWHA